MPSGPDRGRNQALALATGTIGSEKPIFRPELRRCDLRGVMIAQTARFLISFGDGSIAAQHLFR
jgi:hypothetical protein